VTLAGNGGTSPYTFAVVTAGSAVPTSFRISATLTGLAYGAYDVYVKDKNACVASLLNAFTLSPALGTAIKVNATSVNQPSPLCFGNNGTATLSATGGVGGFSYAVVLNGLLAPTVYSASPVFANLPAGTYDVYAKDANSCVGSALKNFVIATPPLLTVSASPLTPVCAGNTATVTLSTTGGSGTYTYALPLSGSPPLYQSSPVFTVLSANVTYDIYANDSNGCVASVLNAVRTTVLNSVVKVAVTSVTQPLRFPANSGSVTLSATGGLGANYSYAVQLQGGVPTAFQSSPVFTGLPGGSYSIFARDSNGCTGTVSNAFQLFQYVG